MQIRASFKTEAPTASHSLPCCWSAAVVSGSVTPWTTAHQASLSFTISQSLLKLMSIESVMPSHDLILCRPLLPPPSIFPSIRVFPVSRTGPSNWATDTKSSVSVHQCQIKSHRALGEVEKKSFIALPGNGGHSRLCLSKTMCPNLGRLEEGF